MPIPDNDRVPYWCDPHSSGTVPIPQDGRRHCGELERVLRRQWDPSTGPPPQSLIWAVDDLASLHGDIVHQLAEWLDGLWLGDGRVPDLDHLGHLRGHQVRPGSAVLWDDIPGALVGRTLVIGTGEHLSVSLTHHEVGHALERRQQLADKEPWLTIMAQCRPVLLADRYRNPYEWWAESWAIVAVGELGLLLRMLSEDQTAAKLVASYHRRYYGLGR